MESFREIIEFYQRILPGISHFAWFFVCLFVSAFPLPPIYQSKKTVLLNNVVLHLNTLTLNPFPEEEDLQVYEAAKHSSLITLRTSSKYFFPAQSVVNELDKENF